MFSLIITIISIVLVGLLAVATIYYGGDAFSNRGDEARADRVLNEGQQLAGAAVLAKNDGRTLTAGTVAAGGLVPEYLTGDFIDWDQTATSFTTEVSGSVCAKLLEKVGTNDKVSCDNDADSVTAFDPTAAIAVVTYEF